MSLYLTAEEIQAVLDADTAGHISWASGVNWGKSLDKL